MSGVSIKRNSKISPTSMSELRVSTNRGTPIMMYFE